LTNNDFKIESIKSIEHTKWAKVNAAQKSFGEPRIVSLICEKCKRGGDEFCATFILVHSVHARKENLQNFNKNATNFQNRTNKYPMKQNATNEKCREL
jgi:hypothetical protein